jgi:hypothetical protein
LAAFLICIKVCLGILVSGFGPFFHPGRTDASSSFIAISDPIAFGMCRNQIFHDSAPFLPLDRINRWRRLSRTDPELVRFLSLKSLIKPGEQLNSETLSESWHFLRNAWVAISHKICLQKMAWDQIIANDKFLDVSSLSVKILWCRPFTE